jgi:hypothetical protein
MAFGFRLINRPEAKIPSFNPPVKRINACTGESLGNLMKIEANSNHLHRNLPDFPLKENKKG